MKKLIALFIFAFTSSAWALQLCGPVTNNASVAYNTVAAQTMVNENLLHSWAVGSGCAGETDIVDVEQMCTNTTVGGQAVCDSFTWSMYQYDRHEGELGIGPFCQCRRTKMISNGTLDYSIGQWVLLAQYPDTDACHQNCAKLCAETVANNENGLRNAIILLSAF